MIPEGRLTAGAPLPRLPTRPPSAYTRRQQERIALAREEAETVTIHWLGGDSTTIVKGREQ